MVTAIFKLLQCEITEMTQKPVYATNVYQVGWTFDKVPYMVHSFTSNIQPQYLKFKAYVLGLKSDIKSICYNLRFILTDCAW